MQPLRAPDTGDLEHGRLTRTGGFPPYKLHGGLLRARCEACGDRYDWRDAELPEGVPHCDCGEMLRPDVVWFGEMPSSAAFDAARRALGDSDAVIEVGTSGSVSYGFTQIAVALGLPVLRINPEGLAETGVTLWPERSEVALPQLTALLR